MPRSLQFRAVSVKKSRRRDGWPHSSPGRLSARTRTLAVNARRHGYRRGLRGHGRGHRPPPGVRSGRLRVHGGGGDVRAVHAAAAPGAAARASAPRPRRRDCPHPVRGALPGPGGGRRQLPGARAHLRLRRLQAARHLHLRRLQARRHLHLRLQEGGRLPLRRLQARRHLHLRQEGQGLPQGRPQGHRGGGPAHPVQGGARRHEDGGAPSRPHQQEGRRAQAAPQAVRLRRTLPPPGAPPALRLRLRLRRCLQLRLLASQMARREKIVVALRGCDSTKRIGVARRAKGK